MIGRLVRFTDGSAVLAAVGSPLGRTAWHVVTASDVASYGASVSEAPAVGDPYGAGEVLAVVARRLLPSASSGVGVVPGGLTVGLASVMLVELLAVEGYVGVDYGLDRVRFPAPLLVGMPVRARGLLVGARCEGDAVRTVVELTYETEDAGRTPCVAQVVSLLVPSS